MPELDPQAELIAAIGSGGWYAVGELPEAVETRLPVVQVLGMPGRTTFEVWGGRTLGREVPFDVYALAPTIEDAGDLARAVAGFIEGVHGRMSLTVQTTPHEVSEFNPRVKRFLFTVAASYRR